MLQPKKIVIIGAGFGGLFCAKNLLKSEAHITFIDKQNHHLFQPLLYQVATGFIGMHDIAIPIRSLFVNQEQIQIVMGEATSIDPNAQSVIVDDHPFFYDYLVIATGAQYHFFGKSQWAEHVHILKTLEDAFKLRHQILWSLEKAEFEKNQDLRNQLLTYVVIGGGPTGVEMAGGIADLINHALRKEFRHINPVDVKIILIEASHRLLNTMPDSLSEHTKIALEKKGVIIKCSTSVIDISQHKVQTEDQIIISETIIWAAGVKPTPVINWLGLENHYSGIIQVQDNLSITEYPNIFLIGDACKYIQNNVTLPGLAAVAKQQGKYVAKILKATLKGKEYTKPFHYFNLGTMATIGRNEAVADFGFIKFKGFFAWLLWGIVHIYFLAGFRNRMVVFLTWVWTYLTFGSGDRIILSNYVNKKRAN